MKIVFIYETPEPYSEALENEIYERFNFVFEGQPLKDQRFPPVVWTRFGCAEFKNEIQFYNDTSFTCRKKF